MKCKSPADCHIKTGKRHDTLICSIVEQTISGQDSNEHCVGREHI